MAQAKSTSLYREIGIHFLFWAGYFLYEWLDRGVFRNNYQESLYFTVLNLPLVLVASYWHLRVTVHHFLLERRLKGFWISMLVGIVVFGFARRAINYCWFIPIYCPQVLNKPMFYWPNVLADSMQLHFLVFLFVAVDLGRRMWQQQRLSETYRREKLAAEYRLLQSQVQPHFLFNTLNNLMSVAVQQPAQVPHLLQRLAGLLSYQLHESHRATVPVAKELTYLLDYIRLEQLRYGDRLDVQTNFTDWQRSPDLLVPPMLLLPFVENAFKHGAAQTPSDCWIQLQLLCNPNQLVFSVENSVSEDKPVRNAKAGLGLINLRKRLDILYPGRYELTTLQEDLQFLAVLKLALPL